MCGSHCGCHSPSTEVHIRLICNQRPYILTSRCHQTSCATLTGYLHNQSETAGECCAAYHWRPWPGAAAEGLPRAAHHGVSVRRGATDASGGCRGDAVIGPRTHLRCEVRDQPCPALLCLHAATPLPASSTSCQAPVMPFQHCNCTMSASLYKPMPCCL